MIFILADRRNGCRIVRTEPDDNWLTISAYDEDHAIELARELGFETDFEKGQYHLVEKTGLMESLRTKGFK